MKINNYKKIYVKNNIEINNHLEKRRERRELWWKDW